MKALITGVTGQDGSYIAEYLLNKGYEVHGIIRRSSTFNTSRIDHIYVDPHDEHSKLHLYYGDLTNSEQIANIIYNVKPDEIYHLGAQSHVRVSFDMPEYTADVDALGTIRILEAVRRSGNRAKMYNAASSEMFGDSSPPQNEETPFQPRSPYAASKVYSYFMAKNYREAYNEFICNGILFNHESPRRGETFVTRKVTRALANILAKRQDLLYLGDLKPRRDWGYAPEYVEIMWRMLQTTNPSDYVIGTGESHSVRDFVEAAFEYLDLNYEKYVRFDARYVRPTEVEQLVADPSKAVRGLQWQPKIRFAELVKILVDADIRKLGLTPPGEGDEILRRAFPNRWWGVD